MCSRSFMEKISHIIGGKKRPKKCSCQALRIGALVIQKKIANLRTRKLYIWKKTTYPSFVTEKDNS